MTRKYYQEEERFRKKQNGKGGLVREQVVGKKIYIDNKNPLYPELNRRITSYEYNTVLNTAIDLGLTQGYMQKKSSAKEEYTPPFGLEGIVK